MEENIPFIDGKGLNLTSDSICANHCNKLL